MYSSYILYSMDHNNFCISKTLKIIGRKWTTLILYNLSKDKMRFGELQRAVEGISPKALSTRLQELEGEGVVNKKIFAEVPLHVEYELTEKGKSLKEIMTEMIEWGARN